MKSIGVIWVGHADYMDSKCQAITNEIAQTLKEIPRVEVGPVEVAVNHAQAISASRRILHSDLCGAIIVLTSWVECSIVMTAIKELRGLPMLLWGFPLETVNGIRESTGSYVSATMLGGPVKRLGLRSEVIIGSWKDEKTVQKLRAFAQAASAIDFLFYSKIGLFGYTSMSIYTGTFDHVLMRYQIGPEVEQMDAYSLIAAAEAIPEDTVRAAIAQLTGTVPLMDDVKDHVLYKTMAIYAALKQFCETYQWTAVNVKCQYEFSKEYKVVPCVALSMLADDGIVASCEGDILNTVSMMILAALSGDSVMYGDALSQDGNTIKFSPCGFMPFSMGASGTRVQKFLEHPGFSGIQVCGVMRPERVTYLRLVEDVGSYHLLYGTGTGLPTEARGGCMPALDVELDGRVEDLCRAYAGQHFALAYGDWSAELDMFAAAMGLKTIRI